MAATTFDNLQLSKALKLFKLNWYNFKGNKYTHRARARLTRRPRSSSVLWTLCSTSSQRPIKPEFARGGRLRPFVYCMLATQLRFWEKRLERYCRDAQKPVVNDQMYRGVVYTGLASGDPGKAGEWLQARDNLVRERFHAVNLHLMELPFEDGGFDNLLKAIKNNSTLVTQLAGTISGAVTSETTMLRMELEAQRAMLCDPNGKLDGIISLLRSGASASSPTGPLTPSQGASGAAAIDQSGSHFGGSGDGGGGGGSSSSSSSGSSSGSGVDPIRLSPRSSVK